MEKGNSTEGQQQVFLFEEMQNSHDSGWFLLAVEGEQVQEMATTLNLLRLPRPTPA